MLLPCSPAQQRSQGYHLQGASKRVVQVNAEEAAGSGGVSSEMLDQVLMSILTYVEL